MKPCWVPNPQQGVAKVTMEAKTTLSVSISHVLRIKNIQLGYTLPASIAQKAALKRLRVFANGSNISSFDRFWTGYDVEAPVGSGNIYPQVKVYSFGLEATF